MIVITVMIMIFPRTLVPLYVDINVVVNVVKFI